MTGQAPTNLPYMSVAEISQAVKRTVETAFEYVRVRGEISQPRIPGSGHLYFTLKDEKNTLAAVMWKGMLAGLSIRPEDGLDVICTGKLTTFGGQSKYQIIVSDIEIAGEGALLKQLEDRKRRLAAEGLFDQARKQSLPVMPAVIGVVTSPTGAVIRDILHRLSDRFGVHVLVWGVAVQGQGAAEQIAAAIEGFNSIEPEQDLPRPDVLIVARGGGSLEDLWAFNEEVVCRAVAASSLPVISAVGHETDTTLIDYVSDLRAPTPSAAAELATPVRSELMARLAELEARLLAAILRKTDADQQLLKALSRGLIHPREQIARHEQHLDMAVSRLETGLLGSVDRAGRKLAAVADRLVSPEAKLAGISERLAYSSAQMDAAIMRQLDRKETQTAQAGRLLEANSFQRILDTGFSLITDHEGAPIKTSAEAPEGADIIIRFADAQRAARLDPPAGSAPPPQRQTPPSKPAKKQPLTPSATEQKELF